MCQLNVCKFPTISEEYDTPLATVIEVEEEENYENTKNVFQYRKIIWYM